MNWCKITGIIILIILGASLLTAVVELNYCHYFTTQPPLGAPSDYIKGGTLCAINGTMAIPGIALILVWEIVSFF
jgi:hypothetical protein